MTGGARPGDPTDWPDHLPELREIDKLLRCPICFEYINTAMLLPCSHNYCSLCIRRYIGFRTQCPTCIESVSEPQIKNNRLVDEVISKFSAVRSKLLQIVRGEKVEITQKSAENESEAIVRQSSRPKKRQPIIDDTDSDVEITGCDISVNEETKPMTESALDISIHTPSKAFGGLKNSFLSPPPPECSTPRGLNAVVSPGFLSPSASTQSPGVSTSQSPGGSTNTTPGGTSNVKKVPCPVCCVEVSERTINLHLDRCLAGDQKKEALRSSTKPVRRKPMPKLVYNLLKDKDLKKKLIEVGLPTDGDRQAMIKRHHEFTLRYNAECDSLQPKSAQEIMQDMQRSDRTKCSASLPSVKPEHRLVIEKGAGSAEVETAQKSYVKQHRSQFAQLIAETRKRQQKLKQASSLASESQSSESRTETITSSSSMDVPLESTLGFSRVIPENTSASLSSSPHMLPSRRFNNVFVQPSRTDCVTIDGGYAQNPNSPSSGKHSPNDHSENEDWENPAGISTVTSPCIKNFFSPTKSKDGHRLDSQTSTQIVSNVAKNLCHEFKQNHEDCIAPTSRNSATNNYNENTRNQGASNVKIRTDSSSRGVDTDREPMPSQNRQTSFHDVSWNEEDDELLKEFASEDGVQLPKCEEKDSNSTEACNSKPNQTISASSDEEEEKTVSRFIPTIRNYGSDSSAEDESEAVAEAGQQGDFSGNFEEDWTHEIESSPPDEDEVKSPSLFSDSQPVACSGTSGASALPYKGVTPTKHAERGIVPPDLPCSGESTLGYEDMACGQNQTPEQLNGDLAEGNHITNSNFTSPDSPVIQSGRGSKRKRGTTPPLAPQQDKKHKGRPSKREPLPIADLPQDILNELEEYRQETRRTTRSRAKKL